MKKRIKGKWFVFSHDGKKKLGGPYKSEEQANARLREVEYYKHQNK